jgi:diacylglycerol kinase (ATP)
MRELIRRHRISFVNAFAGLAWAVRTQPNFRIHFTLSAVALFFAYYFQITRLEAVVIVFTIVLGLAGEMINTSLEAMTDLITTEWRREAKTAKDVAAGMMLLIAIGSVIVAVLIFGPRITGSV